MQFKSRSISLSDRFYYRKRMRLSRKHIIEWTQFIVFYLVCGIKVQTDAYMLIKFNATFIDGGIRVHLELNQTAASESKSLQLVVYEQKWRREVPIPLSSNTIEITDLKPCQIHCLSLRLINNENRIEELQNECGLVALKDVPEALLVKATSVHGGRAVLLRWRRPMEIPKSCELSYFLTIKHHEREVHYTFGTTGDHLITGLEPNSKYEATVQTIWADKRGSVTQPLHFKTEPVIYVQPIHNLRFSQSGQKIIMHWNWTFPDKGARFRITNNNLPMAFYSKPENTMHVFFNLKNSTLYRFRVDYQTKSYEDYSSIETCVVMQPTAN